MPLIKQMVNEQDLLAHFQSIEVTTEKAFQQKRPYISASMCQRQIALNGLLPTRDVYRNPSMKYYAAIGNSIETCIVENYIKANQLIIDSWKLPKDLFPPGIDVGGKIDMIIDYKGIPVLIDVKTIGVVDTSAYVNLSLQELEELEQGYDVTILSELNRHRMTSNKKIKESYQSQLQLYAAITGIDDIYLMSASRRVQDTFDMSGNLSTQFSKIEIDTNVLKRRFAILIYGIMARDLGLEPSKLVTLKKTHCSDAFCSFVNHCWNGEALEVEIEPVPPEKETELKTEALAIASDYIDKRHERRALTMALIEKENERRATIGQALQQAYTDCVKPIVESNNLYTWDVELRAKW